MKLSIKKIKVDPKISSLFPDLSEEEFKSLKSDIEKNGQLKPLILAKDYTLLDGHQRLRVLKALKRKEAEVEIKEDIETFEDKLRVCFSSNSQRRNLTSFQKLYIYLQYREKGLKSQKVGHVSHPSNRQIAKAIGLHRKMVDRCMKIINSGDKELIKDVYEEKVSLREALRKLKGKRKTTPKMYPLMIPYELYERYEEKFNEPRKTMIEVLEKGIEQ